MKNFYDKVFGCWLGKCLGGNIGQPFEGMKQRMNVSFTEEFVDKMIPNDDLDLQILWLDVMKEKGLDFNAEDLADAFHQKCPYAPGEYAYFKKNYQKNIMPPLSGSFNNEFFNAGMGSPIRSEIWACLFADDIEKAISYAKTDSTLDHYENGDSFYGEVYLTALECLCFYNDNPYELVAEALKYIPGDCDLYNTISDNKEWLNLWIDSSSSADFRCAYMKAVTDEYRKNFSEQLSDWCHSHGVMYTGHIIEDNGAHLRTVCSAGHYFKAVAGMDFAGVDVVLHQIKPYECDNLHLAPAAAHVDNPVFFNFLLAKLAKSSANLSRNKNGNALCELFGAYGWGESTSEMLYIVNHMLSRGINVFVPHAFSMHFGDYDCPPHFYAQGKNPAYKGYIELFNYMRKMANIFSDGKNKAPVAIMYHDEAEWSGKNYMPCEKVAKQLTENQIDFNIVYSEHLQHAETENGKIVINNVSFDYLVIPTCDYLTKETVKTIKKFENKVLCIENTSCIDFGKTIRLENLCEYLFSVGIKKYIQEKCKGLRIYRNKKGFYGLQLYDEPFFDVLDSYGLVCKTLKKIMPAIYLQCNLNPLAELGFYTDDKTMDIYVAYEKYLNEFIDKTEMDCILFDNYPFRRSYIMYSYYLQTYQIASEVCKNRNIELRTVMQSFAGMNNGRIVYRYMTERDMYWQVNLNLGFGSKELSFFTYMTKQEMKNSRTTGMITDGLDGGAFINRDGTKTKMYYYSKRIIKEIKALSNLLYDAKYQENYVLFEHGKTYKDYDLTSFKIEENKCPFKIEFNHGPLLVTKLLKNVSTVFMIENIGNIIEEYKGQGEMEIYADLSDVMQNKKAKIRSLGNRVHLFVKNNEICGKLPCGEAIFIEIK